MKLNFSIDLTEAEFKSACDLQANQQYREASKALEAFEKKHADLANQWKREFEEFKKRSEKEFEEYTKNVFQEFEKKTKEWGEL